MPCSWFSFLSEIDLKDASKFFASKFSCGSSVSGDDEIVIQGDVKDDLFDFLPEKWSQVRWCFINSYSLCSTSVVSSLVSCGLFHF